MVYQSFNNENKKIEKNWNRVEDNGNDLNNIPLITLNFNSLNFSKIITTIPLITNQNVEVTPINKVQTILLENFPEWVLNMIEPNLIFIIEDGFVSNLIDKTFQEANNDGTLKTGDVSFIADNVKYWFNRIDNRNFFLKIFYKVGAGQAVKTELGFFAISIPVFANISLKIYNHRIYETMNEKFE